MAWFFANFGGLCCITIGKDLVASWFAVSVDIQKGRPNFVGFSKISAAGSDSLEKTNFFVLASVYSEGLKFLE